MALKEPLFDVTSAPHGSERTSSPTVGRLITMCDADEITGGERRAITIDFTGDYDAAHQRTKSWRRVCTRLGYVLRMRANPEKKKLTLWATKTV